MFVSRAENKLNDAVKAFKFDFREKTVLDIGSSTGGFSELALTRGAKKVFAVEKGTKQMKAPLRYDPRIELHEKTDIFNVSTSTSSENQSAKQLVIPVPDVILADISFISLRKVLSHIKKNLAGQRTDLLVMLKPQFEARADELNKGIVKNEKIRRKIIYDFENWLKQNSFIIKQKRDNIFLGKNGNQERFYWLKIAK